METIHHTMLIGLVDFKEIVAWLFMVSMGAMVVLVPWFEFRQRRRRRELIRHWASERGFAFDPVVDREFHKQFPQMIIFNIGSNPRSTNFVRGIWNHRNFTAIDFLATVGGGKNSKRIRVCIGIIQVDKPLKQLRVRSEGPVDRLLAKFGHNDINFESAQFSSQFYVEAEDRRWAYDVLHARTIEQLLSGEPCSFQFDDHHVLAYRPGGDQSPKQMEEVLGQINAVIDAIPAYALDHSNPKDATN